jgi:hypothetical protein
MTYEEILERLLKEGKVLSDEQLTELGHMQRNIYVLHNMILELQKAIGISEVKDEAQDI